MFYATREYRLFQFPSNGKVYPKPPIQPKKGKGGYYSFNSLQTGRCIQSIETLQAALPTVAYVSIPFKREGVSKGHKGLDLGKPMYVVSIPFKREGVSKGGWIWPVIPSRRIRFNSLQTGRCIQRGAPVAVPWRTRRGFNSLQTGRCIQRRSSRVIATPEGAKFQFPSNGKVYPKTLLSPPKLQKTEVSIPFKREGVSKGAG